MHVVRFKTAYVLIYCLANNVMRILVVFRPRESLARTSGRRQLGLTDEYVIRQALFSSLFSYFPSGLTFKFGANALRLDF